MRSLAISAASKSKSSSAAKSILAVVQKRCISAKTPTCKSISSTTTNTRPAAPSSLAGLAKSAATTPAPARRAFASHATKFQSRCAFNTTNSNTIHAFRRRFFSQYIDHFASSSIEPFDFVNEETLQHFPWAKLKNCYTHLENRCVLCVEGEDAAKFLQGLITNDINAVTKKDGIFAMMLNSKGRVLYEVLIFPNTFNERIRRGEGEAINSFLIECDRNLFSSMRMHLMKYKLRSKVNFVDYSNTIRVHAVMGPDANSNTIEPSPTTITFADPRLNELGVRMYSMVPNNNNNNNSSEESNQAQPAITLPAQFKQFPQAPQTVYNALRIMLGVPEGNEDLPSGDCFPLESNLDLLHGVSFHKGCYLGQELTARTHHSGVTRKRIVPAYFVRSEHDIISPETMGIIPSSGTTSTYASASASVPTHHKANTAFTPSLVSSAYFAKFRVMDETQFGPDAHLPPPGSPIKSQPQEKQVGKLCSHVFNLALCLLRTDEAFGEPEKSPRLTCEGFIAVPVKPFWLEQHEARERAEREERERLAAEAEAAEMAAAEQEEAEVEGEEEAASATTATARA